MEDLTFHETAMHNMECHGILRHVSDIQVVHNYRVKYSCLRRNRSSSPELGRALQRGRRMSSPSTGGITTRSCLFANIA